MYIPEPRFVVVGYDGSPNSRTALRRAAGEARQRHARLDVVRVCETRRRGWPHTLSEWVRLRNAVAQALPRAQHIATRLRIAYGRPGEVLPRLAGGAELLAIGARADSQYLFGGETVQSVLFNARCDVMISTHQQSRPPSAAAAD